MTITTTKPTTIPAGKPASLVIELSPERAPVPIQDLRCVSLRYTAGGSGPCCTIGEAASMLNGPSLQAFLAHGTGCNVHAVFEVQGTAEVVAERLGAYRAYSDECYRKAVGRYTVGELAERIGCSPGDVLSAIAKANLWPVTDEGEQIASLADWKAYQERHIHVSARDLDLDLPADRLKRLAAALEVTAEELTGEVQS